MVLWEAYSQILLNLFYEVSSFQVNYQKSNILFSIKVINENRLCFLLGTPLVNQKITYMGILISYKKLHALDF